MMDPMRGNNGPRYRHLAEEGAPYDTITIDKLTPISVVANIRSSFALKQVKYETALPLHPTVA